MKLGSIIPKHIEEHLDKMSNVLAECKPYHPDGFKLSENEELYNICISSAKEILRFMFKIRRYHKKILGE